MRRDRLAGKRVHVTDRASGIGDAIVQRYLEGDAAVAVAEMRSETREQDEGLGGSFVTCDVESADEITQACCQTIEMLGDLDVAVADAGYELLGDALEFV
jgi:NAD(P)-dependent dehydrogenase (short-subunit alcohol dehydrogenase family)